MSDNQDRLFDTIKIKDDEPELTTRDVICGAETDGMVMMHERCYQNQRRKDFVHGAATMGIALLIGELIAMYIRSRVLRS